MNGIFAIAGVVIKEMYRRKDFYVLFILTALITLVLASVSLFGDDKIVRFLKEACLLLIWISSLVIGITTAARQIPAEKESRTIFPLLAKPVGRGELICGKFLGCWLASGIALVIFYLFFVLVTGSREHDWPIVAYAQALWLHWMFMAVVIAMAVLGSIVFAAPSSNSTILFVIVGGILFFAQHLSKIAINLAEPSRSILYTVYFAIPHLEFFDIRDLVIHRMGLVPWSKCFLASLYGAAYTSIFLLGTWILFRKKSLA
jgi:ABC-type transport system involved in multi-copper enzyme maturation permease subunit